jgi:hypothetical protein
MKKILLYFILIMAVGMAGIVAYVSVTGLLKVFTGAGTLGLLLFSSIEISKIVATSAIHTYGKRIGWLYKLLLSLGILIAMVITSMGIYGFLSSTYKESFSKFENTNAKLEVLEKRRDGYKEQFKYIVEEKVSVNTTITELSSGLSNNVIQYRDRETGEILTTTSSSTRRALEKQLDNAVIRQDGLNIKADSIRTLVFDMENQILETKLGDKTSSELGPLKYLAEVTGKSMDEIMKWFILLLIVIGDPMAVLMVIVFNKVINYNNKDDIRGLPINDLINNEPNNQLVESKDILDKINELREQGILNHPNEEDNDEPTVLPNYSLTELEYDEIYAIHPEINETKKRLPLTKEEEIQDYVTPEFEVPDEITVTEIKSDKITLAEIKEVKERDRGFSVTIPTRKKKTNVVSRIGSNKEVRDSNNDTIFFKRK